MGLEEEAVFSLLDRATQHQIRSAFTRGSVRGAIYVEACLDADMISPLNLTPGIIRKCCIFLPKIPYRVQLSDIIVLSRATVHDFLDLEAVVDDDVSTDET